MTLRWLTSWDITMVWRIRAGNQELKAPTPGPLDTEDGSFTIMLRRVTIRFSRVTPVLKSNVKRLRARLWRRSG